MRVWPGPAAAALVAGLDDGDVVLLENLRFDAGETSKDAAVRGAFGDRLAALAALGAPPGAYVDDAFGAVHRAHASVVELPARLPHYAGGLVLREVEVLQRLTEAPAEPYVVILGGSKVSDKLAVIEALLPTVDRLLVGGGMCFTFLAAQGHDVGGSLLEEHDRDLRRLLASADGRLLLPTDVVVAAGALGRRERHGRRCRRHPERAEGAGHRPGERRTIRGGARGAATVFWNGPMGVFELAPFAEWHPRRRRGGRGPAGGADGGRRRRQRCRRSPARHSTRPASATSRRAAGPASNTSKARLCRGWRRSMTSASSPRRGAN